jgi:hypothetical protein
LIGEAERLGGLEVDDQLELDRGLDRKLAKKRPPIGGRSVIV